MLKYQIVLILPQIQLRNWCGMVDKTHFVSQDMELVLRTYKTIRIQKGNPEAVYYVLIESGVEVTDLYIYLSAILFVSLTCVASVSIQVIIEDVRTQILKLENKFGSRVRKWRHTYGEIHNFIGEIDNFFGPILLLFFARMFIYFIISVFKLTLEIINSNANLVVQRVVYFTKVILYISMLAHCSHKMRQQVNQLSNMIGPSTLNQCNEF